MITCPSPELLERFLDDTLSEEEREAIETHVENCAACLGQLERLTASAGEAVLLLPGASASRSGDAPAAGPAELPAVPGYEILEAVGAGGMGVVYKARDPHLDRLVALKLPTGPVAAARAARFHREAQALARLQHENIVALHAADFVAGRPYFVMQFVNGGSLARQVERFRKDPRAAAALIEQVARAVHHAHTQGVLHRDLKPANILLDEAGKPWVSDFGLAKLLAAPDTPPDPAGEKPAVNGMTPAEALVTHPGGMPGTPAYMAPEQLTGAGAPASPAPDVWALGVVLYELLTGRRPFTGQTLEELREQIRHGVPVPPRKLAPRLDRWLERIALRCLEKEPGRRYPTAAALADALAAYRSRRPWWQRVALLGTAAAALAAAGLVALAGRGSREEDPYQKFLRDTAPVRRQLERGEAVDLLRPGGGGPPYFVRAGAGATKVGRGKEGLNVYSSGFGLVELLPFVPAKQYRIVAELRHAECDNPVIGMAGLFHHGAHAPTAGAQNHLVQLLWLNDQYANRVAIAGRGEGNWHQTWYRYFFLRLDDNPREDRVPYWFCNLNKVTNSTVFYPPLPPGPSPWRRVVLDVDEQKAVVRLNIPSRGRDETTLVPVPASDFQDFLRQLRHPHPGFRGAPELNAVDDRQFEPKTFGVCVSCGRCVVRRLRIEPLPANGR